MMKRTVLIPALLLMAIVLHSISAANNDLKSILSNKEIKRIESAEKLIGKGDALMEQTKGHEAEIEQLKNAEGRTKTGKIKRLNKKIAEVKIKASLYYQDGYKRYIDVLDDHMKTLEKSGNSEAAQARDDVKSLERKARKLYNKAENKRSAEEIVELIELAQTSQQKAIELHTSCLVNLSDNPTEEIAIIEELPVQDTTQIVIEDPFVAPLIATTDSSALVTDEIITSALTTENTAAVNPAIASPLAVETVAELAADSTLTSPVVEEPAIEEAIIEETPVVANPDVFFTIQIMADKKKASDTQLNNLYNGSKEVIEMQINDWFKYSIGRYQDLEKAKADMSSENIKGFIVAYNKSERISVKEAVALINGES